MVAWDNFVESKNYNNTIFASWSYKAEVIPQTSHLTIFLECRKGSVLKQFL